MRWVATARSAMMAACLAVIALTLTVCSPWPSSADAKSPPLLWKAPEDGVLGSTGGRLANPLGSSAADQSSGDVYVADRENARVSEFTAWGEFVKAWGWGVRDGAQELQVCTAQTSCQAGIKGSAAGQFDELQGGIALNESGDIYVGDQLNHRVEMFDPEGGFLAMFGGEVNKTTGANLCTNADEAGGDECGVGVTGSGDGEFSSPVFDGFGNAIGVGATGSVYVGDNERIQVFNPDGSFKEVLPDPEGVLAGQAVQSLAVDPTSGDLYVTLIGQKDVRRLNATTGSAVGPALTAKEPRAIAVDSHGNVYVMVGPSEPTDPVKPPAQEIDDEVIAFDPAGDPIPGERAGDRFIESPPNPSVFRIVDVGLTTSGGCEVGTDDIYVSSFESGAFSYVSAYGPPPQNTATCPPPKVSPTILSEQSSSVGTEIATLSARINPNFWADTKFYVEYGTGECSKGGCLATPSPPGQTLTAQVVRSPIATPGIQLSGLSPNTTYHYRFVAQSGGGGPVSGQEGAFTTFPTPLEPKGDCLNQPFRIGRAARLPDCRAYEMVSPVDKGGADIKSLAAVGVGFSSDLNQSAADGDSLTFSSQQAFGDALSAPYTSQYLARRTEGVGWTTQALNAPRGSLIAPSRSEINFDNEFKLLSADLCSAWLLHIADPPLAAGMPPGFLAIYRRENCGAASGGFEGITTVAPTNSSGNTYRPEFQGASADGSVAFFRANGKLTANASAATLEGGEPIYQLYEANRGKVRLASVLPNSKACDSPSSAGNDPTKTVQPDGRTALLTHAVSADGSRVYWTCGSDLYVRAGVKPSALVATGARFRAAAADGSKAIYSVGEQLFEFDLATKTSTLIAGGVSDVPGASEDASRVYFVSSEEISGHGEAGKPNLYLYEAGGAMRLVATGAEPLPFSASPTSFGSRVTPDGGVIAFASASPLTGYDNRDAASGEPDMEVYVYDATTDKLACVSCNVTGARPVGRLIEDNTQQAWIAARLPAWNDNLAPRHDLSTDGRRLFFQSFDALVPRDTNGREDIYEWQAAPGGAAECQNLIGGELYLPESGGCFSLISSGESPEDSEFVDASPSGGDVFFKTASSLVVQDPGLIDVYDARAGGGLPSPGQVAAPCEGEACQNPGHAPEAPSPASANFSGPGSKPQPRPHKPRCSKKKARHGARKRAGARCPAHRHDKKRHPTKRHHKHHGQEGRQ